MGHPQLAGQAAVQRLPQLVDGIPEAVLGNAAHGHVVALLGGQHLVALFQAGGHGLFHHHVFAGVHGVDGDFRVGVGRGAHVDHVNGHTGGQHLLVVVKDLAVQVVLLLHGLGLFGVDVAQGHNLAALREGEKAFHMGRGNVACAHNGNVQHRVKSSFSG